MKKLISLLVVLAMLMAISPAVFAEDGFGVGGYQEMVIGENVAVYTAETDTAPAQPAYFIWTAEMAGTLTIDFSDEDEGTVWCNVLQTRNGVPVLDQNIEEHGGSISFNVEAGDIVSLQVEEFDYQDAELHFTASFVEAVAMSGSGTEADPWIVDALPETLTGTISEADAADEEWMGYYYQFTATELGTVAWGPWSGCGVFITMNGAMVDADFVEVQAGDVVLINVWALFGAGSYSVAVDFTAGASEEPEVCTHEYMWLEPDYCYEDETLYDLVETCECGYTGRRYTPGTEKNPIMIEVMPNEEGTEAYGTVTVPAGETIWFGVRRVAGMMLSINGEEYGIMERIDPYDMWSACAFEIVNDTAEEATYELLLTWPIGTADNPDDLVVGESFELALPENNDGYVYEWIAPEAGELVITVEGENWFYYVNNFGDPESYDDDRYGDWQYAVWEGENTFVQQVKAGDQIIVGFGTQDADFNSPAETLTITVTFTAGEPEATPLVLGDNAMANGYYQYTAEADGTLYFRVTSLAFPYGDISDRIRNYFGNNVMLYVNGELCADGYFGFVEVVAGDVVTFEWIDNSYYAFSGTLNLSYENNNPVVGSQERPVHLEYTDCPAASIEIAPGESVWYELTYDFYDAVLLVKGENAYIEYDYEDYDAEVGDWVVFTKTIEAVDGVATLFPIPTTNIRIGNAGTEAAVFEIDAYYPVGSAANPAELVEGDNVVDVEENRPDYYYYGWTAPSDGTITIVVSGDSWHFYVMNITTYETSDWLFFYGDYETGEVVNTVVMEVAAGDQIVVGVVTCVDYSKIDWSDPNMVYPVPPAGTITTNFTFTPAETPCAHENLVHVEAKAPSCYEEGNIEHWYCEECETVWADEALTMITNHLSVILPATHQHIVHVEAKAPSCYEEGNVEYWYCEDCVTVWVDENLMQISNMMSVVLPATHQHIVHVEAVAPTCTENGNVEYWYCEDCVTVWVDENLMQISNMMSIVAPATGHTFVEGVCTSCGANDQNVPPTGDMIAIAFALVAVSGMTVIALPKKKEN